MPQGATQPCDESASLDQQDFIPAEPFILLIDDHALFGDGLAAMVAREQPGWRLYRVDAIDDALSVLATIRPALVIVDLHFPHLDALRLMERLGADPSPVSRLVMSSRQDEAVANRARLCGADGYVAKAESPLTILAAIRAVLAGGTAFAMDDEQSALPSLTQRQTEVLDLLNLGCGNKEIRYRLNIAERTVRAHLTDLFHALGAQGRMQALIRARQIGLVA